VILSSIMARYILVHLKGFCIGLIDCISFPSAGARDAGLTRHQIAMSHVPSGRDFHAPCFGKLHKPSQSRVDMSFMSTIFLIME